MSIESVGLFAGSFKREEETITLPSGRSAVVLETTGKEEALLRTSSARKDPESAMSAFLASCVKNLDGSDKQPTAKDLTDMLSGDRTYLLLAIRKLTHGEIVEYKLTCPECNSRSEHELHIDDIFKTLVPYPNGDNRDFFAEVGPIETENGSVMGKIWYSLPTGKTEKQIAKVTDRDINIKLRCMSLWEETEKGSFPIDFDNLRSKWIVQLRKSIAANECKLDTTLEVECTQCRARAMTDLTQSFDFLFPAAM